MNKKNIVIEQTLHGYSQGHHLLASSIELSKNSQRIMSILSDLSGPEMYEGFSKYLTGYPLVDDNYYALAKTWYASEMDRPGCVWTHTLLVRFDDLENIGDGTILFNYFDRPSEDFEKSKFDIQIELYPIENSNKIGFSQPNSLEFTNEMRVEELERSHVSKSQDVKNKGRNSSIEKFINVTKAESECLIWSIYGDERPIILPSDSADKYLKLILRIWGNQWVELRKNFSFCTGSLANRKLGKRTLDVQCVPRVLANSIGRSAQALVVLEGNIINFDFRWMSMATDEILYGSNRKFKEFLEDFGCMFKERKYFGKLAQLYIDTGAEERIKSIDEYLTAAKVIFDKNDYELVVENLLCQLNNVLPNKWFGNIDLASFFQDLSTTKNLDDIPCTKSQLASQLESLWSFSKNKAKMLFRGLISRDLNNFGEALLREFSQLITPEQLPLLSDMDLGACNVLVSLNPKFALCSEIWKQSRNFQREIMDCIDTSSLDDASKEEIIRTILENNSEVLYEQMFKVFGKSSITAFLDWCKKTISQEDRKIKTWMKICVYNPEVSIKWLSSIENLNISLVVTIITVFDPYSEVIRQQGMDHWIRVFKQLNHKVLDYNSKLILAQFFLPLILMSNEVVPDDFVKFSFDPIYEELAKSRFDYEQWIKLEPLLPLVPWYSAWDKCKRLRRALEQKRYLLA